jgi:hypothetical protein
MPDIHTNYTPESVDPEVKQRIDELDQVGLARTHRFAPFTHPFFKAQNYPYFRQRFDALGGMTPQISKLIGWDK